VEGGAVAVLDALDLETTHHCTPPGRAGCAGSAASREARAGLARATHVRTLASLPRGSASRPREALGSAARRPPQCLAASVSCQRGRSPHQQTRPASAGLSFGATSADRRPEGEATMQREERVPPGVPCWIDSRRQPGSEAGGRALLTGEALVPGSGFNLEAIPPKRPASNSRAAARRPDRVAAPALLDPARHSGRVLVPLLHRRSPCGSSVREVAQTTSPAGGGSSLVMRGRPRWQLTLARALRRAPGGRPRPQRPASDPRGRLAQGRSGPAPAPGRRRRGPPARASRAAARPGGVQVVVVVEVQRVEQRQRRLHFAPSAIAAARFSSTTGEPVCRASSP